MYLAGYAFHRRAQYLRIDDAHYFDVREFAHGPGGVVVDVGLRIVRRPVLVIEQGIGDAAVGLVHADDVTARRACAILGLQRRSGGSGRTRTRSVFFLDGGRERRGRATDLNTLRLQRS